MDSLEAWKRGKTGYPLVDAAMRELWETGYMQQNARMIAAHFLCEVLGHHWIEGAKWFHYTLMDADLAINSMMWQSAGIIVKYFYVYRVCQRTWFSLP